jgi:hypothetical protein
MFNHKAPRWPRRKKTIHDAAARRVSMRAQDKLEHALDHIDRTKAGEWFDPVIEQGDRASSDAYNLLTAAMTRVQRDEKAAHLAAGAHVTKGGRP